MSSSSLRGFPRAAYYRRLAQNYVLSRPSHLGFWHERPEEHPAARFDALGPYYMTFADKAAYSGPFDGGVPLLDYGGSIGPQHNPIAIAQYGLALYNRHLATGHPADRSGFLRQADWLRDNLVEPSRGPAVWVHRFDWEYRTGLRSPWPSGLAQGQAISLLLRAHASTSDVSYLRAAAKAFPALLTEVRHAGLLHKDPDGGSWIEEYLVDPPSHILNGFLWALWGVWDYHLATQDARARALFGACAATLARHLHRYDTGWWSLYEIAPYRIPMLASPFYHRLHIVQLRVTSRMTGDPAFARMAERWEGYAGSPWNRGRALATKAAFKVVHY